LGIRGYGGSGSRALVRGILRREPSERERRFIAARILALGDLEAVVHDMVSSREFEIMIAPQIIGNASVNWCGRHLGFVHIPKTAGTSSRLALIESAGMPAIEMYDRLGAVPRERVRTMTFWPLIVGHANISDFPPTHSLLTVFREPRARLLSLYRQRQNNTKVAHLHTPASAPHKMENARRATENSFITWLRTTRLKMQADYITGIDPAGNASHNDLPAESHPREDGDFRSAVETALDRMNWISWAHQPTNIEKMIATATGRPAALPRANIYEPNDHSKPQYLDAAGRQELWDLTAPDRFLIEAACGRGLIPELSPSEADALFEESAKRLGFHLT